MLRRVRRSLGLSSCRRTLCSVAASCWAEAGMFWRADAAGALLCRKPQKQQRLARDRQRRPLPLLAAQQRGAWEQPGAVAGFRVVLW